MRSNKLKELKAKIGFDVIRIKKVELSKKQRDAFKKLWLEHSKDIKTTWSDW